MARLSDRPPPPGSGFPPPAQGSQRPPAAPALRQRAVAGLLLAMLSVITMMWGSNPQRLAYVAAVALAVALAGLALAFSAMRATKRARARRPGSAVAALVIGVIGAVLSGSVLGSFLLYPSQTSQYLNCLNGATTSAARSACWQQLQHSVGATSQVLRGK